MAQGISLCFSWNPEFGLYQAYEIYPHFAFSIVVFSWNIGYAAFTAYPLFRLLLDKPDGYVSKGWICAPCWFGILPPIFIWGLYLLPSIVTPYLLTLMCAYSPYASNSASRNGQEGGYDDKERQNKRSKEDETKNGFKEVSKL